MIEKIENVINGEIRMEEPHTGLPGLRDLVERRLKLFFTSVEISIFPTITTFARASPALGLSHENLLKSKLDSLPHNDTQKSPATGNLSFSLNPPHLFHTIILKSRFDFSGFERNSCEKTINVLKGAHSKPKDTHGHVVLSSNSLRASVNHANAPRIYHKLFKVVNAYGDVLVDWIKTTPTFPFKFPDHVLDAFRENFWELFLPKAGQYDSKVVLPVPASSIEVFNYSGGQFVKKGSPIVVIKGGEQILAKSNFILLHYTSAKDTITYNKVDIDNSLSLNGEQRKHADFLLNAYDRGRFNVKTYKQDMDLNRILQRDVARIAGAMIMGSKGSRSSYLPSYHPSRLKQESTEEILQGLGNNAQTLTVLATNRFEFGKMREQVAKAELSAFWNVFIPGSQLHCLASSEVARIALERSQFMPFVPQTTPIPIKLGRDPTLLPGRGPWFWGAFLTSKSDDWGIKAIIKCPEVPINHDPEIVQHLLGSIIPQD